MSTALTKINSVDSRQLIVATAGHVDHGKSALIKQLTGIETDTLQVEKERGLTINLGYAYHHFRIQNGPTSSEVTLGFVDVPGHSDFIHNMLAGVSSVDSALLVVASDDGIMPQTREHLAILSLLGIEQLTVAISKIDRVEKARTLEVEQQLSELLTTFGFTAPLFQVSNITGAGVSELKAHLISLAAQKLKGEIKPLDQEARFLIDRSFNVKGIGTVVTGCLRSGQIKVGDRLLQGPSGEIARVRSIRLDQKAIQTLRPGQRAALSINLDQTIVKRGDWLMDNTIYHTVTRFDCRILATGLLNRFKPSARYHLYHGCGHYLISIRALDPVQGYCQILSPSPLSLAYGDRFIIRDPAAAMTLAGGHVVDLFVPRRGRASEARLKELAAGDQPAQSALENLLKISTLGVNLKQFRLNHALKHDSLDKLLTAVNPRPIVFKTEEKLGGHCISQSHYQTWCDRIRVLLKNFHSKSPSEAGISESALSNRLNFSGAHEVLSQLLELMRSSGLINLNGTLFHLPNHRAQLSREQCEFIEKVQPRLKDAGKVPPRTLELVEMTGIPLKVLQGVLREAVRSGSVIQVADNRHFLPETISELASFTESLANQSKHGSFTVIAFRDASGIGRNLCIEILEYFDAKGFTRRDGNTRLIRAQKEEIFK
ncbi:MAG: selenocysteine-specific translation elongation factor [Gammaproteobacteria bacterium]|nr:selenocysteine-specific translation elongation factor [Gammaproteobacteria bacterium]